MNRPPNRQIQYRHNITPGVQITREIPAKPVQNAATLQAAKAAASALFTKYGQPGITCVKQTLRNRFHSRDDMATMTEDQLKEATAIWTQALENGLPWMLPEVEMKTGAE